jgi:hypothetical protein
LSRNIQNDDHTHNRQRQQRPHIFTFHKFFRLVVYVWSPSTFLAFSISTQITGQAGHMPWGITLPWIMGATALRKQIQRKMCSIASPEFVSNGCGKSKHSTHRARNHQFFGSSSVADAGGILGQNAFLQWICFHGLK